MRLATLACSTPSTRSRRRRACEPASPALAQGLGSSPRAAVADGMQRARSHRRLARLRRGGFYAGCTPAIQRAALVNLGELTTYDSAKKEVVKYTGDNLLCLLPSAICSGFVA